MPRKPQNNAIRVALGNVLIEARREGYRKGYAAGRAEEAARIRALLAQPAGERRPRKGIGS